MVFEASPAGNDDRFDGKPVFAQHAEDPLAVKARHVVVRDDEPAGGPAVLGEDGGDPVEDAAADVDVVGGVEPPVEIHPDPVHDGTLPIRCMAVSITARSSMSW